MKATRCPPSTPQQGNQLLLQVHSSAAVWELLASSSASNHIAVTIIFDWFLYYNHACGFGCAVSSCCSKSICCCIKPHSLFPPVTMDVSLSSLTEFNFNSNNLLVKVHWSWNLRESTTLKWTDLCLLIVTTIHFFAVNPFVPNQINITVKMTLTNYQRAPREARSASAVGFLKAPFLDLCYYIIYMFPLCQVIKNYCLPPL